MLISPACLAAMPSPVPPIRVSSLSLSGFPWGVTPVSPKKQQRVLVLGPACVGTAASSPSCRTLPRAADTFKHTLRGVPRAQRCSLSQRSVPPLEGMIRESCMAAAEPACPESSHQPLCRLPRQPPHTADSPNSLPPGKAEHSSTQIRSCELFACRAAKKPLPISITWPSPCSASWAPAQHAACWHQRKAPACGGQGGSPLLPANRYQEGQEMQYKKLSL